MRTATVVLSLVSLSACDLGTGGPMPPDSALFLPSPKDGAGGSSQAVCASDAVFAELELKIARYNAEIGAYLDALEGLKDAPATRTTTGRELVCDGDKGSVRMVTVEAGDASTFTVEITPEDGEPYEAMAGTLKGDEAGTLSVVDEDGEEVIDVVWAVDNGTLSVTRSATIDGIEESAVYTERDDEIAIVFQSDDDSVIARWNPQTKVGALITEDDSGGCWGEPDGDDFCDIDCADADGVNVD